MPEYLPPLNFSPATAFATQGADYTNQMYGNWANTISNFTKNLTKQGGLSAILSYLLSNSGQQSAGFMPQSLSLPGGGMGRGSAPSLNSMSFASPSQFSQGGMSPDASSFWSSMPSY